MLYFFYAFPRSGSKVQIRYEIVPHPKCKKATGMPSNLAKLEMLRLRGYPFGKR